MDSRIREGIVDRGIERGEWEMRNLSKQLGHERSNQEPHAGRGGRTQFRPDVSRRFRPDWHNALSRNPKMKTARAARHQQRADIHERKVDPEAVRESEKEAELDPIAETEPEEGETAA